MLLLYHKKEQSRLYLHRLWRKVPLRALRSPKWRTGRTGR